jgi:hypothetical protein
VAVALRPMLEKLERIVGPARDEIMAPQGLSVWARAQGARARRGRPPEPDLGAVPRGRLEGRFGSRLDDGGPASLVRCAGSRSAGRFHARTIR